MIQVTIVDCGVVNVVEFYVKNNSISSYLLSV